MNEERIEGNIALMGSLLLPFSLFVFLLSLCPSFGLSSLVSVGRSQNARDLPSRKRNICRWKQGKGNNKMRRGGA